MPHPPYFPNLALLDCRLFDAMKNALSGKYYGNHEEVKITVKNWLRKQLLELYMPTFESRIQLLNAMVTMLRNSTVLLQVS